MTDQHDYQSIVYLQKPFGLDEHNNIVEYDLINATMRIEGEQLDEEANNGDCIPNE